MKPSDTRRIITRAVFLGAAAMFAVGVWWFAFISALDQLSDRGRANLALASDRLTSQLQRFRELSVLLADHPTLEKLVLQGGSRDAADALLLAMADKTGSFELELTDVAGTIIAASGPARKGTVRDAAFNRAMDGALGTANSVDVDGRRILSYASPIFSPQGPVRGAVIVRIDVGALESNWPAEPSTVFFTDSTGVVFVANRSDLILSARWADAVAPTRFPSFTERRLVGHSLWTLNAGRYLPKRAMHLALPLPVIGMTGEILLDLTPAQNLAFWQAAVAVALFLAFGGFLFMTRERLRTEAAANAALEARVAERTAELSTANRDLLREVGERIEAESALKRAQNDLVQAGKLSALGQMSAGISHELNQPLMAIQTFAENGSVLLDRGKPAAAAENLGRISELARRMGRIIKNLRAFARQETADVSDVDLGAVVDAALEITRNKIDGAGVEVTWARPSAPLMVRGGEVRLQQVVLNLLSNAVDAMISSQEKYICISVVAGDPVRLIVQDSGPGIAEPAKIFDPFYSTKEVGVSEGMGLGLSISYGLVQSFGGAISGRNRPEGGAEFMVELTPAMLEQAA